jgi:hypothetical protein
MSGTDIELEQLEAALRADAPEPSPAFAAELDRRVAERFPKPPRRRLSLPSLWPALAAATVLVVVAVVAISVLGGGADRRVTATFHGNLEPRDLSRRAAPTANSLQQFSAASSGRRVERDVQLTIAAARDKLQQAADGIGTVAESHRGFVLSSHVTTGGAGPSGGSFELRVPQRELQATIADLSKLGDVRSRSENGQDVTAPYNHIQDRLGTALVERRTLKLRLRHTQGAEADSIRARIATLNAAIDTLNARMKNLRSRTVFSTVSVTLEEAKKGSGGGTGAAFDDARRILEGMLNFCVRALAVLLPLGLVIALAAFGTRILRKRRREAALQ